MGLRRSNGPSAGARSNPEHGLQDDSGACRPSSNSRRTAKPPWLRGGARSSQASLLLVFTPQQCGIAVCTQRQNIENAFRVAKVWAAAAEQIPPLCAAADHPAPSPC